MAKTTADLWFRFFSDTKGLTRGSAQAERDLSKTEKAANKAQKGFSSMQKALGALGLAIGAREVAKFAYEATQLAEKANIAAKAFDTTFGPSSDDLRESLEETRKIMGLTSLEMETALLPLGQLSLAFGLTREEGAEFSDELFVIAGDLAAFDGDLSDSAQALGAVQSALKGEFDPLEQFGIKLKQADITARALEMTGKDLASELTNQELALATLNLMLEQTTDETGSLVAMQDTAQGSTNKLTAEFGDLKIELGQALLPTLVSTTKGLLTSVEAMNEARDSSKSLTDRLKSAWKAYVELMKITPLVGYAISTLSKVFGRIFDDIGKAAAAVGRFVDRIRNIPSTIKNPFSNWSMPSFKIPGFATGGTVGGPRGAPQLAVVHGGEEINTPSQQATSSRGGGGGVTNIYVDASLSDPQAIAARIVDLLSIYNRTSGPIPVVVRDGIG